MRGQPTRTGAHRRRQEPDRRARAVDLPRRLRRRPVLQRRLEEGPGDGRGDAPPRPADRRPRRVRASGSGRWSTPTRSPAASGRCGERRERGQPARSRRACGRRPTSIRTTARRSTCCRARSGLETRRPQVQRVGLRAAAARAAHRQQPAGSPPTASRSSTSCCSDACRALDLPVEPELYIGGSGEINAFTAGVDKPIVVLNVRRDRPADRRRAVLRHRARARPHQERPRPLLPDRRVPADRRRDRSASATFGIGELLGAGLQVALLNWKRKSEFTADRAGLLATQDVTTSLGAMMKLAGLPQKYYDRVNVDDFIAQARAFEAMDNDKLNWIAKWLSSAGQTHPWTVLRANQFLTWVDDGGYEQVLQGARRRAAALAGGSEALLPALRLRPRRTRGVLPGLRPVGRGARLSDDLGVASARRAAAARRARRRRRGVRGARWRGRRSRCRAPRRLHRERLARAAGARRRRRPPLRRPRQGRSRRRTTPSSSSTASGGGRGR